MPITAAMSETTAGSVPTPEDPRHQELRERVTLVGFVVVSIVASVVWFVVLAWLAVAGLRSLGL